jgi:hypothetical protein
VHARAYSGAGGEHHDDAYLEIHHEIITGDGDEGLDLNLLSQMLNDDNDVDDGLMGDASVAGGVYGAGTNHEYDMDNLHPAGSQRHTPAAGGQQPVAEHGVAQAYYAQPGSAQYGQPHSIPYQQAVMAQAYHHQQPPTVQCDKTEQGLSREDRDKERWEHDEPLGNQATIAAVLHANLKFAQFKYQYPNWPERLKQIQKIWRQLSTAERQEYVQMARDNRTMAKQQRMKDGKDVMMKDEPLSPSSVYPTSPSASAGYASLQRYQSIDAADAFKMPPNVHPKQRSMSSEGQQVHMPNVRLPPPHVMPARPTNLPLQHAPRALAPSLLGELLEQEYHDSRQLVRPVQPGVRYPAAGGYVGSTGTGAPASPMLPTRMPIIDPHHQMLIQRQHDLEQQIVATEKQLTEYKKQKKSLSIRQKAMRRNLEPLGQTLADADVQALHNLVTNVTNYLRQIDELKAQRKMNSDALLDYQAKHGFCAPPASGLQSTSVPRPTLPPGPSGHHQLQGIASHLITPHPLQHQRSIISPYMSQQHTPVDVKTELQSPTGSLYPRSSVGMNTPLPPSQAISPTLSTGGGDEVASKKKRRRRRVAEEQPTEFDEDGTEIVPEQTIAEALRRHIAYATPTLCETVVACMPRHKQDVLSLLDEMVDRTCVNVDGECVLTVYTRTLFPGPSINRSGNLIKRFLRHNRQYAADVLGLDQTALGTCAV